MAANSYFEVLARIAEALEQQGGFREGLKGQRFDFETDDGDGVLPVMNTVRVHFETVGVRCSAAKSDQRLSGHKRLCDKGLRLRRNERADGRKTKRMHHRMGACLRQYEKPFAVPRRHIQTRLRLGEIGYEAKSFADIVQKLRLSPGNLRMRSTKPTNIVHADPPFP